MNDPNRFLTPQERAKLAADQRAWRAERLAHPDTTNVVCLASYVHWRKTYEYIDKIGCSVRAHLCATAVRRRVREERKRARILAQAAEREQRQKERTRAKRRHAPKTVTTADAGQAAPQEERC